MNAAKVGKSLAHSMTHGGSISAPKSIMGPPVMGSSAALAAATASSIFVQS